LGLDLVSLLLLVFVISAVISNANMPLLIGSLAVLFITPPPPNSDDRESDSPPEDSPPPSPVLLHQVVVTNDVNVVHRIHWRPFPAVAHPPPPQLYANQQEDGPDHPDCQTCNLAGSVGHCRCSPCRPCRRPRMTAEIDISPQCTLPVSATNGHDLAFSWEEDFDGWFERDNAAAAANALAAPFLNQADWEEHEDVVATADALGGGGGVGLILATAGYM
jgi:hypothetical protein